MIRGIGPVYARKLVRAFSEKVFDVIEAEPDRLREVGGKHCCWGCSLRRRSRHLACAVERRRFPGGAYGSAVSCADLIDVLGW
jgi:hypothetical protein